MVFLNEPIPLATDPSGVIRVGSTRVTLDSIVAAFNEGLTVEGIVELYPSLQLADGYAVLAYYLNHRVEVEAYLQSRQNAAESVRNANEQQWPSAGVRERLLARKR